MQRALPSLIWLINKNAWAAKALQLNTRSTQTLPHSCSSVKHPVHTPYKESLILYYSVWSVALLHHVLSADQTLQDSLRFLHHYWTVTQSSKVPRWGQIYMYFVTFLIFGCWAQNCKSINHLNSFRLLIMLNSKIGNKTLNRTFTVKAIYLDCPHWHAFSHHKPF